MDGKEAFFTRWSRRKLETKEAPAAGAAKTAEPGHVAAAAPPEPELPEVGTPEFREYFDPRVDETLRRTALKKLFSDPHYNVMDGLDTYIDDYSIPDPIPEAMLRQLNQAKDLFLFDDEKQAGDGERDAASLAAGGAAPAADAPALPEPPPASATAEAAVPEADAAPARPAQTVANE